MSLGNSSADKVIKENHEAWYEGESWESLGLTYDTFYKIFKGKVEHFGLFTPGVTH